MKKKSTYFLAFAIVFIAWSDLSAQEFYQFSNNVANDNPHKIYLAPNPVSANSYFDLVVDSASESYLAKVLVYDWSGNVRQNQLVRVQPGRNVFQLNIGGYDQGTYVVRMIVDRGTLFSKSMQLVVR
jgi:hypothetical protein